MLTIWRASELFLIIHRKKTDTVGSGYGLIKEREPREEKGAKHGGKNEKVRPTVTRARISEFWLLLNLLHGLLLW